MISKLLIRLKASNAAYRTARSAWSAPGLPALSSKVSVIQSTGEPWTIRWHRLVIAWLAIACAARAFSSPSESQSFTTESASWPGADLFTNGAVCSIRLEIAPQDLEKLRKESREFVPARVTEAGTVYEKVAVHLKGSVGSFRPLEDKPALTLDFCRFNQARRFHGLRRIHLNNSVEDPSYCNEQLGSELFRAAGVPAPRVGRAIVTLNQRRLGLYVLKEGFTEDFLSCYFKRIGGNLYEPDEGHDVNQHLKRTSIPAPVQDRSALKALAAATLEPQPDLRWKRLDNALELNSFIRFMALEIMLCHRDGYCLARNNFRLYQDRDSGKMIFFPHGMDQLFGSADLTWKPHMAGLVAKAVMETPEGAEHYSNEFKALFQTLFKPELLAGRVDQSLESLRPVVERSEFKSIKAQADLVKARILERFRQLDHQLNHPLSPLQFTNGVGLLDDWTQADAPGSGMLDQPKGPDGVTCLHVRISSDANSSWRTRAHLDPGRYRFEGKVRVSGLKPLPFGTHQGAGLRIGGQSRQSADVIDDADWHLLRETFEVGPGGGEVEFICEFRGKKGEAWFDCSSLRVVQEP